MSNIIINQEKLTHPGLDVGGICFDDLVTTPKARQLVGQEKLWILAHSFYRGGILGDPVGLGKSLTVALFSVRFLRQYPRSGPVIIVCRKSCVLQWEGEFIKHFKEVILGLCHTSSSANPHRDVAHLY